MDPEFECYIDLDRISLPSRNNINETIILYFGSSGRHKCTADTLTGSPSLISRNVLVNCWGENLPEPLPLRRLSSDELTPKPRPTAVADNSDEDGGNEGVNDVEMLEGKELTTATNPFFCVVISSAITLFCKRNHLRQASCAIVILCNRHPQ